MAAQRAVVNGEVLKSYIPESPFEYYLCTGPKYEFFRWFLIEIERRRSPEGTTVTPCEAFVGWCCPGKALCSLFFSPLNPVTPDSQTLCLPLVFLAVDYSSQAATPGTDGSSWLLLKGLLSLSSILQEMMPSCLASGPFSGCSHISYVVTALHPVEASIPFCLLKSALNPVP